MQPTTNQPPLVTVAAPHEGHNHYFEIDALRGAAVLLMALYHLLFDLHYFYEFDLRLTAAPWQLFARGIASVFLLLIGIMYVVSYHRTTREMRWRKAWKRCAAIAAGAAIVSVATWFVAPVDFVKFGILHLIAVSAVLQPLFMILRTWNIPIGSLVFIAGMQLGTLIVPSPLLFPFGIRSPGFSSLDYYPLLPWFGAILIGMGAGSICYVPARHPFLRPLARIAYPSWLLWCGRHSLLLYLLHQPMLLVVLWFILR